VIFADSVPRARHIAVAANGDVFVATPNGRGAQGTKGGIVALRDTNGDGKADTRVKSGANGGNGIALRGNYLYFAPDDAVLRYAYKAGELTLSGVPDTLVRELPATQSHTAKTIVLGRGNELFVNIGSPSNSCQQQDRSPYSPGKNPCPDLETRAGIWQFDATKLNQRQSDGARHATGLRNTVALTLGPDGSLWGATRT
jgi:glucose/arabinose dehydrogenase